MHVEAAEGAANLAKHARAFGRRRTDHAFRELDQLVGGGCLGLVVIGAHGREARDHGGITLIKNRVSHRAAETVGEADQEARDMAFVGH